MSDLATWSSGQWRREALAWADERLTECGLQRIGAAEQPHLRAWATALRIPTSGGPVWLKAPGAATAFEVDLYPLLHGAAPNTVLQPLAVEPRRRWLLLPDGGPPLGEVAEGPALVEALISLMPRYARMQRQLSGGVEDLLRVGVADLRPLSIPQRYTECLGYVSRYVDAREETRERTALSQLRDAALTVRQWAAELAESAVPPTLDHNDLHPWNLLCEEGDPRRARVYDWGDAVVGHPFATLMVILGWLASDEGAGLAVDSADVLRVRDAYLAEFADLAPHGQLVRDVELAGRSAKIGRAWSWCRVVQAGGIGLTEDLAGAPLHWLSRLLSEAPGGD